MLHLLLTHSIRSTLTLTFASLLTVTPLAMAQSSIRFTPPTPPDLGNPSDRGQGGGRRGCDDQYAGLSALVPMPRPNIPDDRWGLTVSDRPTIWFDVPTGISASVLAEWRLRNGMGETISKTVLRLPKTQAGVIGLAIPVPLAIGNYQWDLALYCNSSGNAANDELDAPAIRKGRIQRVAAPQPLREELATANTPLEQANAYAKYGMWHDALTLLGTQLRSSKNDQEITSNTWNELLKQQRLQSKSSGRVTSCCTLPKQ